MARKYEGSAADNRADQAAARKAMRHLFQIYEKPIGRTSIRFFPPVERNHPTWMSQMKTLEGLGMRESDHTVVAMTRYLLALDELYDQQAVQLRGCMHQAKEAETRGRSLRVQLVEAQAQATEAESHI